MQLTGITDLVARLDPLRSITTPARAHGLLNAAKPVVSAALQRNHAGPLILVTAHPQAAEDLVHELAVWTDGPVALFPAIEALPYERVRLDRTVLAQRESAARDLLRGDVSVVVAPARALLQPLATSAGEAVQEIALVRGTQIDVDGVLTGLVDRGYASVPQVEEPGTFARRGGVIDIFPAGADHPVRLELFGREIESMRSFDPATQRSLHPIESVIVPPIATIDEDARLRALERLMALDTSTLTAEAETAWMNDLCRLEAGASIEDLALLGPYLQPESKSLAQVAPPGTLVIADDAESVRQTLQDLWSQAAEVQDGMVASGILPPDLEPALIDPKLVIAALREADLLEWLPGSGDETSLDWSELFSPAKLYGGRVRAALSDLRQRETGTTVLAAQQYERLAELLDEESIPVARVSSLAKLPSAGLYLLPAPIAEGWRLPSASLQILGDHELFGRSLTRPVVRQRRPARDSFFAQFSPGDYVVHLEHGIGRFGGITRMALDGVEREYGLVQYAGSDRVYVPTDQLERLTRYIGSGETPPQLNKLGGGEWQRARARAKKAADDIARELIDVYAKRMARPAHGFAVDTPWQHELESAFAFPETPDQLQAIAEVKADMEEPRPMDRLVCADVGYGKTEVAVRAAFKALMDGRQVAVLVPTTILAQQHFETFAERFAGFPVTVEVLSRFRSASQLRDTLRRLAAGEVDIIIGTHRLLSKDVSFKNLGLLIVDEEQRFGVRHKEQLRKMREAVDVLTLTATPIPRTLHMGLVGIREISVIETPPEGRLPIKTYLQPTEDRLIREAILRELDRGGQVYIVHNKVATIDAMAEKIRRLVPEARLLVGHGQMDESLLEGVMMKFAHHEADVLLCSTIIENGLDIPNVNTIIVNNAQRLGLTQLYQLRGRVGRSANQAYAYLLYPRDVHLSHDAMRRLEAVFEAQELGAGMSVAMKDLEIRGVGNLLGAEQSGQAAAIGFDLYTRMIGEAVERMRGMPSQEASPVTIDLPLTTYLPAEYVGNEAERLTLYRRLAAIDSDDALDSIAAEMVDRFGALPTPANNLLTSVRVKLAAQRAHVTSVSLSPEILHIRAEPNGLYDRVALYRAYGSEARINTNVLRIPRPNLGDDWLSAIQTILTNMAELRASLRQPQPVEA